MLDGSVGTACVLGGDSAGFGLEQHGTGTSKFASCTEPVDLESAYAEVTEDHTVSIKYLTICARCLRAWVQGVEYNPRKAIVKHC
jgi:hypothetical protein